MVNLIAPEHLELLCRDPTSLVAACATRARCSADRALASVGDYIAGPEPRAAHRRFGRFGSALTVSDFTKHLHVITSTGRRSEVGPHVEALATAEGLDATRTRSAAVGSVWNDGRRRRRPHQGGGWGRSTRHPRALDAADDVAPAEGYHAAGRRGRPPQHERVAGPAASPCSASGAGRRAGHTTWHRYPDRAAPTCGRRSARCTASGLQVFAANGSNEVLQTLCLTFGGPVARSRCSSPRTRCTGTSPASPAPRYVGERTDASPSTSPRWSGCSAAGPTSTFLCSPNNLTGSVRAAGGRRGGARAGPGPGRGGRGLQQFAPPGALRARRRGRRSSSPAPTRRPGRSGGGLLEYLVGPAWLVAELEKVVLPYTTSTRSPRPPGGLAALHRRDGARGRAGRGTGRLSAALGDLDVDVWPSGANFVLFRPRSSDGAGVAGARRPLGARPQLRAGPASTAACGSPSAPAEDDAFLQALEEII